MDSHLVLCRRLLARALFKHLILKARRSGLHLHTLAVLFEESLAGLLVDLAHLRRGFALFGLHGLEEFLYFKFGFVVSHFRCGAFKHGGHAVGKILNVDGLDARRTKVVAHAESKGITYPI